MGRDTTADTKPLLQDAEQNIGNSAILIPEAGTGTVNPQTNPPRLLQLTGGSARGQTTSIIFTASRLVGALNPHPGLAGPITGIVEFGSGGRFTKAEIDVPIGPFLGTLQAASLASEPQDGGIIITVPTSVVRAYLRYDNLLIHPILSLDSPPVCLAQRQGVAVQGPGGPITRTYPYIGVINFGAEPVQGKAMAAYFSRHFARAYKTLYCYVAPPLALGIALVPVSSILPGAGLNPVTYTLPAFTRSLKILRMPIAAALTVGIFNGVVQVDSIDIPAGTAPIIPIVGHENVITIVSQTPTDLVALLALSCEIGI